MTAIVLILCLLAPVTGARDAAELVHAGRFAEAGDAYRAALDEPGVDAAAIWFNLGNCAFRLGHYAEAALDFRRAAFLRPNDREISFNLRLTELRLGLGGRTPSPVGSAYGWFEARSQTARAALIALLELIAALAIALVVRGTSRISLVVVGVGAAGLGILLAVELVGGGATSEAVMITEGAGLRAEPHLEDALHRFLPAGSVVRVEEMSDRWVHAELDGERGWIERAKVGLVDPAATR